MINQWLITYVNRCWAFYYTIALEISQSKPIGSIISKDLDLASWIKLRQSLSWLYLLLNVWLPSTDSLSNHHSALLSPVKTIGDNHNKTYSHLNWRTGQQSPSIKQGKAWTRSRLRQVSEDYGHVWLYCHNYDASYSDFSKGGQVGSDIYVTSVFGTPTTRPGNWQGEHYITVTTKKPY